MGTATKNSWKSMLGLAGVGPHERARARRWARLFEAPLIIIALWLPFQWYLEVKGGLTSDWGRVFDWFAWSVFFVEAVTLTSLVKHKRRYLYGNWLNLVIIVSCFPVLWDVTPIAVMLRSLRLLLLVNVILRFSRTLRGILSLNSLGYTLMVSFVIILLSGTVISSIDPAIDTPWDGIWWAWVTVTTVGYGDIVPQSGAGRLFAGLLILLGIALFSLLTANFSAYFIGAQVKKVERREKRLQEEVSEVEQMEADIEKDEDTILLALRDIQGRLKRIEERLEQVEEERRKNR